MGLAEYSYAIKCNPGESNVAPDLACAYCLDVYVALVILGLIICYILLSQRIYPSQQKM